jgi:hypothetical protein
MNKTSNHNWEKIEITLCSNVTGEAPFISVFNYKKGRVPYGHIRGNVTDVMLDVKRWLECKLEKLKKQGIRKF